MTMEQFEQTLEKEERKKAQSHALKNERWSSFWRMCDIVVKNFTRVDCLPITLNIHRKTIHFDDVVTVYLENKVIWNAFDESGRLIAFTLDVNKNVNLVFEDNVLCGKVKDINEKDDPKIQELTIFSCVAGDVTFKVSV